MTFHPHTVQTTCASPLGTLTLAASPSGLAGLWFAGQRHWPMQLQSKQAESVWPAQPDHPVLRQTAEQLAQYFAGERTVFVLPLDLSGGTAFQRAVWQALRAISAGQTCSYRAISVAIAKPSAVRAVGAAVGRNPISIIVPCHRVLGANGALTGYAGGLDRKTALLNLETAGTANFLPLLFKSRLL